MKVPRPIGGSRQSAGVGKIFVKFDTTESAKKALQALAGRKFADRTVVTTYFPEVSLKRLQRASYILTLLTLFPRKISRSGLGREHTTDNPMFRRSWLCDLTSSGHGHRETEVALLGICMKMRVIYCYTFSTSTDFTRGHNDHCNSIANGQKRAGTHSGLDCSPPKNMRHKKSYQF